MFQILEALVRANSKLNLSLRMDGDQMVVVVVPMGEGKDAALRLPNSMKGSWRRSSRTAPHTVRCPSRLK
jgi:PRTRC genetic system protein E